MRKVDLRAQVRAHFSTNFGSFVFCVQYWCTAATSERSPATVVGKNLFDIYGVTIFYQVPILSEARSVNTPDRSSGFQFMSRSFRAGKSLICMICMICMIQLMLLISQRLLHSATAEQDVITGVYCCPPFFPGCDVDMPWFLPEYRAEGSAFPLFIDFHFL